MAHTKAKSASKNLRDSQPKYLGVKRQHGQAVNAGEVLIRQRGTRYILGTNVRRGNDDTIYAAKAGTVEFRASKKTKFDGNRRYATKISVKIQ